MTKYRQPTEQQVAAQCRLSHDNIMEDYFVRKNEFIRQLEENINSQT
jgi:hypothetical protein